MHKKHDPKWDKLEHAGERWRPLIFQKYSKDWKQFAPFKRLIVEYERKSGSQGSIRINKSEEEQIWKLLRKRCSPSELKIIEGLVKDARRPDEELRDAFFVEYRRAYPAAHDAVQKAFRHSDYAHEFQFLAVDLGLISERDAQDYCRRKDLR